MKRFLLALLALALATTGALAQSTPNLIYGQVPTAAQWNSYFAAKQDLLSSGSSLTIGNLTLTGLSSSGTSCVQASSTGAMSITGSACGGGGGGAVNTVTNSDGTLTVSPTTGAVVASLTLGHANTWTATQTFPAGSLTLSEFANIATSTVLGNFSGSTGAIVQSTVPSCANDGVHALTNNASGGFNCTALSTGTGVTSVSNSNGTLTISPTTGAVVASLALGHANTWTATQTFPAGSLTGSELANATVTGTQIATNTITNSLLAQMPADTVKCNNTSGTANVADCTNVVASMFNSLQTASSWFSNDSTPANFVKSGDRFWGGDAINNPNTAVTATNVYSATCSTGDWFANFQATTSNLNCGYWPAFTMIVESKNVSVSTFPALQSSGGILGAGQTKFNNFGGATGVMGFALNNNVNTGSTGPGGIGGGWAFYGECDVTVNATHGGCFGAELEAGNFVSDAYSTNGTNAPDPFQQAFVNSVQLGCGSGLATPTPFKCAAAAQIVDVGNLFRVGLNVLNGSITTQTLIGSTVSPAVAMPVGYAIVWYSAANTPQGMIQTDSSNNLDLTGNANITFNAVGGDVAAGHNGTVSLFIDTNNVTWFTLGFGCGPSGHGGSVTQSTSITTAVTLNKPCGAVTTVSNSFSAGTEVSFSVNDSTVAATDTVVVNMNTNVALAWASNASAGSFIINIYPLVSATTAVVLNFAVVKAVSN